MKNTVLSGQLKAAVMSHLNNEPMDVLGLTPDEAKWLQYVWLNTGLKKKAPTLEVKAKKYFGKRELIMRLKIVLGEITSGNDNPKMVEELRALMTSGERHGWIKEGELNKLSQFITLSE